MQVQREEPAQDSHRPPSLMLGCLLVMLLLRTCYSFEVSSRTGRRDMGTVASQPSRTPRDLRPIGTPTSRTSVFQIAGMQLHRTKKSLAKTKRLPRRGEIQQSGRRDATLTYLQRCSAQRHFPPERWPRTADMHRPGTPSCVNLASSPIRAKIRGQEPFPRCVTARPLPSGKTKGGGCIIRVVMCATYKKCKDPSEG